MRSPETLATGLSPASARVPPGAGAPFQHRTHAACDLVDRVRQARLGTAEDGERRAFRLGWKASVLLNLLLLTLPIGLVIGLPPHLDCHERAERFGLYAGDTIAKCTARGIEARLNHLEARLKMLVRGSGR